MNYHAIVVIALTLLQVTLITTGLRYPVKSKLLRKSFDLRAEAPASPKVSQSAIEKFQPIPAPSYLESLFSLKGKVAIVTGSTGGLGRAVAESLYQAGASVVINGRDQERTEKAVQDIYEKYGRTEGLLAVAGDMSLPDYASHIVRVTTKKFGRLDILCNNAGINIPENCFEQNAIGEWDKISGVNLKGPMQVTRAALPHLKRSPAGRIINLSSIGGHVGLESNTLYTITKGGILMFTKSLAAELAKTNITVNSVSPGVMKTSMNAKFAEGTDAYDKAMKGVPMKRMGMPGELAGVFLLLASESSNYITATDIIVDGGYSAI